MDLDLNHRVQIYKPQPQITSIINQILHIFGCKSFVFQAARYENGSDGYDNFVNPSSPTYTKFYFFNLTNPDEVLNGTEIPRVEEVGPYVYRYGHLFDKKTIEVFKTKFGRLTAWKNA